MLQGGNPEIVISKGVWKKPQNSDNADILLENRNKSPRFSNTWVSNHHSYSQ